MILQNSKYFVATTALLRPTAVIALSITLIYTLFFSSFFRVSTINCTQDVGEVCQNEYVQAEVAQYLSLNLTTLDTSKIISRLRSGDPTIRSITMSKSLPRTLNIDIQSVYPSLALTTKDSERIFVLDDKLRVIKAVTSDPHVPFAIYDQPLSLRLGQQIEDPKLRDLLNGVIKVVQSFPPNYKVRVDGDSLELDLGSGRSVLFTINSDLNGQIDALKTLLNNATIPASTAQIDLRYSQPVLRDKSSL